MLFMQVFQCAAYVTFACAHLVTPYDYDDLFKCWTDCQYNLVHASKN